MIELSSTTALMLYLGMTIGSLFGIWFFQHFARRKKKMNLAEKELFVCEYCHFCYLEERNRTVNQCPQCKSYNKMNVFNGNNHHESS